MVSWSAFARSTPELAEAGRRLLYRRSVGEALLASVRDNQPPRIHPIYVSIVDGRLYAFLGPSAKRDDLVKDGRYALHSHVDPAAPGEFMVRGRVRVVDDPDELAAHAADWYFETDDTWSLVEFSVERAVLGERRDADEWPPRYSSWRADG